MLPKSCQLLHSLGPLMSEWQELVGGCYKWVLFTPDSGVPSAGCVTCFLWVREEGACLCCWCVCVQGGVRSWGLTFGSKHSREWTFIQSNGIILIIWISNLATSELDFAFWNKTQYWFWYKHLWTAVLPTSVFMVRSCLLYRASAGANHHIWCPAWGRLVSCRAPTIPWSFSSVFSVQFWLTSFASAN